MTDPYSDLILIHYAHFTNSVTMPAALGLHASVRRSQSYQGSDPFVATRGPYGLSWDAGEGRTTEVPWARVVQYDYSRVVPQEPSITTPNTSVDDTEEKPKPKRRRTSKKKPAA